MMRRCVLLVPVIALVGVNAVILWKAEADRSWGALGLAFAVGPMANGLLALVSLACTPLVRRFWGAPIKSHVLLSIAAPAGAIVLDALLIFSMDPHGC